MAEKVAFIGLGIMGSEMARHLAGAGFDVAVHNRTRAKAEAWVAANGGRIAVSPAEAAAGAVFVASCVGDDDDLRAVTVGSGGAFAAMATGAIFCDHTTASALVARECAAAAAATGIAFLDAPVAGAVEGAIEGALTVFVGGEADAATAAIPYLEAYAGRITHLGPAGSGQIAKMINQTMVAANLQSLAEAMAFARETGQDAEAVRDVMRSSTAATWMLDNRAARLVNRAFATDVGGVDIMIKDLRIVLDEARRHKVAMPASAVVAQFFAELAAQGRGRWETASLMTRLGGLGGKTR
jgi:3-hydroxyisobutyrate dehydrogenase-like beta-hydroxyacid dehydrogenase